MTRLKNKVCLITGAAKGIGKATAELFIKEGAIVILSDLDDKTGQSIATTLGEHAEYHHLDVSNEDKWATIITHIKDKYGKLDVLVNNAGICLLPAKWGPCNPEHISMEAWHHTQAINADSVVLGCKHAISLMKNNKADSSIVNMSSRSGCVGVPTMAAYAASKAIMRNYSKTVALYCAQQGYKIRCNSLHPAAILTDIWEAMLGEGKEREEGLKEMSANIPLKRMGTAEDVANAVVFFASEESSFITGAELQIDGGLMAGSASAPKDKHHS
jgi:3(or 17)beta-hydroxysteroid dehydrogenase